jgi:rhamnosyltransferase
MREDLFIDFVDVEWCLRARSKGFVVLGVCAAGMTHSLGDTHIYSVGRMRHVHSPLRLYYQVRNALWLYRSPQIAFGWKLVSSWRLLLKCGFYVLRVQPRSSYCQQIALGLKDGFFARLPQPNQSKQPKQLSQP